MNFKKDVCIEYIKENYTDFHEKRGESKNYFILSDCGYFSFGYFQDLQKHKDLIYFKFSYDEDFKTTRNPSFNWQHRHPEKFNYIKIKIEFLEDLDKCFNDEEYDTTYIYDLKNSLIPSLNHMVSQIEKGLSYKQLLIDLPNKQRKEHSLLKI